MRTSIALKINLILLTVVLSLGTSLGMFFIAEQHTLLSNELNRRLQLFGGYLAESVEQAGSIDDTLALDLQLKAATLDKEISYIMVKSLDGEIRAARWVNQTSGSVSEYTFPLHVVNQATTTLGTVPFGEANHAADGEAFGQLAIGVDLAPQHATMRRFFWRTAGTVLMGAVASMLLGFFFVRFFLRHSITPLLDGIRRIGAGELSHRFSPRRNDEIDEIATNFNEMAEQLSNTLISKEQLEATVAERTGELKGALEEQIRSQSILAEREGQIRLLLDSTAEAIYGLDTHGNCTFCNTSCISMLGYEKDEDILGRNMHSLIHHSRPDKTPYPKEKCGVYVAFRKGEGFHCDSEVFWKADGTSMHVEYWAYPVWQEGKLTGAVVTFLDISERILLTAQLIQAQKMESIGHLAGGVAHDFNNLLTPIIGYSGLLIKDLSGNDVALAKVGNILKASEKARDLVQQLLSFSRKQILEMKIINLNQTISAFQNILRQTIRESIDIHLCLTEEPYAIRADRNQIEQVIINLAVNAQDAIDEHGVITIETALVLLDDEYAHQHPEVNPGRYLMLAITDNGCGMDQETRLQIFEPFFTTKGVGKGTGLGLATVYGIVRQHGGNIWVYSEPGRGTTFKCYFPLVDKAPISELPAVHEQVSLAGERRTILLVEDNDMVRTLVDELLTRHGFEVLVADEPKQALLMSKGCSLDLLIADVVMPDMTGPKLHARLLESCPGLKVLYMSGYTSNVIAHQGVLDEGINYIQKPFAITEFLKRVEALLAS